MSVLSRFKILEHLKHAKKAETVSSLVELTGLKQPTVTFHINRLVTCGLLKKHKSGRIVYCQTNDKHCASCPLL